MSAQNNQPVIPFETGIKQVFNKWKQMGWVCLFEIGGYAIYDANLERVCSNKNIRATIKKHIANNVAIPVREDKFQAAIMEWLWLLPWVQNVYGVYRPDIPERLIPDERDDWYTVNTCHVYKPTTPPPADTQLVQPWLDILAGLLPNPKERKRVIQFIAHALQKPMEKPSFALLITGAQGNGKSTAFMNVLQTVLGETYSTTFNNVNQLSTSIGAQRWANRLFCFVDDFYDQTKKTADNLKAVITQRTACVKKLYQDETEVDVITRFIFISNEQQPLVFPEGCDRRFYAPAYANSRNVATQVDDYMRALKSDPATRDALYWYLMTYDISDFNPHVPEETENHMRMCGSSVPEVIRQFEALLSVTQSDFINRNWYEHMLWDYFNTPLTPSQLDNQWKQVQAYLRARTSWSRERIHTKIDGKDVNMIGWAVPGFNARSWLNMTFKPAPEHIRGKWLFPVATY